ncbi:hypothetical protein NQ315_009712 [Exocentrus adspersus]|uniref:Beta-hexosaminidase n=1 Tax=Exocentrus adspersus TaxID=1586481 RepID=A0AAV8WI65_9CUCU|nr:hypothetical protein NQ315_009712 [Exocentrus adspersus]
MIVLNSLISSFLFLLVNCYIIDPGPTVIATKGEVWPKPYSQQNSSKYYGFRPVLFQFTLTTDNNCNFLQDAFSRYHKIVMTEALRGKKSFSFYKHLHYKKQTLNDDLFLGYLDNLNVTLKGDCKDDEYPSSTMNEEYELKVDETGANLVSPTIWGVLRGLETFSQLVYLADDTVSLRINLTEIEDKPRFPHRGLHLDTSRHFMPVDTLLVMLDAMSYNKMNVFHWHITDDQSFPYVSLKFPELSEKGAYASTLVYSPADVKEIIEYARLRGIRVLPEFDTPGHTRSWGEGKRDILTECYPRPNKTGKLGPIDPTKNSTYEFLKEFFDEVGDVFPDQYIHLGGDEVGFECWQSNPDIIAFMKANNMSDDFVGLESYYIQKLIDIVDELNSDSIVWEEVFVNGVVLPQKTIVHVWKDVWQVTVAEVVDSGRQALLSTCWYLDHLGSYVDWHDFYACEPYSATADEEKQKLILGGEACMWAEEVNEYNVVPRVWPRASAAAEKLWSRKDVNDVTDAAKRLEEHTCRMNRRGVAAQPPNYSGYCL